MKLRKFSGIKRILFSFGGSKQITPLCQPVYNTSVRHFGQPAAQTHPHLIQNGEVTPGITKEEYHHRRCKLMSALTSVNYGKTDAMLVIIPSGQRLYMSHDVPYTFRQNTDFFYLSGFQEPDSCLLLEGSLDKDPQKHVATLFVPKKDPLKELWEGPRSGVDGAVELTGIDNAFNLEFLSTYLSNYLSTHSSFSLWYDYTKPVHPTIHSQYLLDFMKENKMRSAESPKRFIQSLRLFKSKAEMALMQKSNRIASEAFKKVMKFSHAKINEASLYAKMDFECRHNGAEYLAYPPVVAGGNRANTIHYINNNQIINDGEMVLMDAGCELHGYTSDITRTWPVSGEFSPGQREMYEAVLEIQNKCIDMCTQSSHTLESIFIEMLNLLGQQLERLGLTKDRDQLFKLCREFCPHHIGHYLGMDVHDTDLIPRNLRLQPGMCITIEPGLYIPNKRLDIPAEYRGNGIRIEDNILFTQDGVVNLTEHCPKDPDEIEKIVSQKL